eukprot:12436326-Alexandrium_andersonii.AAC.1
MDGHRLRAKAPGVVRRPAECFKAGGKLRGLCIRVRGPDEGGQARVSDDRAKEALREGTLGALR